MPFWQGWVSLAVEHLLSECAPLRLPIDLTRLAIKQGIAQIHFRPMPSDGAIEVVADGFVVHMQCTKQQLVPTSAVDSGAMSARQRFTLAHEISHTFFYDAARQPREPHPTPRLLERSCNHAAQRLLLPEHLLAREIGTGGRFDSIEMALDIASAARVSTEVVLQRMDELDAFKETDYAILTLRRQDDSEIVTTGVCMNGVFGKFPRPTLYGPPPKWVWRIAPELSAPSGAVHRSAHSDGWDIVSRCVANRQSLGQVIVESRLEMSAAQAISTAV